MRLRAVATAVATRVAEAAALVRLARMRLHGAHRAEGFAGAARWRRRRGPGCAREIFSQAPAADARCGSTHSGMPTSAKAARRGLVTNSIAMLPITVTTLRSATDMLEPTTLRSSSVSADRRETSSPLRVRSRKPASSASRWAYRRSRRSATTRSPSSETKKKRAAVASASASGDARTAARRRDRCCRRPGEALVDHLPHRDRQLSVAVEDAASATSQATNRPRVPAHERPQRAQAADGGFGFGCSRFLVSSVLRGATARIVGSMRGSTRVWRHRVTFRDCRPRASAPGHGWRRAAGFSRHRRDRAGRRTRRCTPSASKSSASFSAPNCGQRGMHRAGVVERRRTVATSRRRPAAAARRDAQAFGRGTAVRAHQAAGAELDAAVPARDHHHHLVEALAVDRGEDRPAGGAGGFAVVAEAVFAADAIRPAVVRGGGIARPRRGRRARLRASSPARRATRKRLCLTSSACAARCGQGVAHCFGSASRARRSSGMRDAGMIAAEQRAGWRGRRRGRRVAAGRGCVPAIRRCPAARRSFTGTFAADSSFRRRHACGASR